MGYDFLVVGSGMYGSVFAERLRAAGRSVLVLEKRDHIGGNCFTYPDPETRINVHRYGAHIFHTNDRRIWAYVRRFTEFNGYRHRVLTRLRDRVYSLPINLGVINHFFGVDVRPSQAPAFLESKRKCLAKPRNLEEKAISLVGQELYEAFIQGYTEKQWGCDPRELPASIINRLPVRFSYHDDYFDDRYQGIPCGGYTPMFERLLQGVPVETKVDFLEDPEYWRRRCRVVVYTGPIDRYFRYRAGPLSWRSVRFEREAPEVSDYQGTSVMNYAERHIPYTRIHEPKHFYPETADRRPRTVIFREYPQPAGAEPYYPVRAPADMLKLAKYRRWAASEPGVIFGGRLGEYRYYDMHQVIGAALRQARTVLSLGAGARKAG